MSEFKIGDKVRFKDKTGHGAQRAVHGDVGTVIGILVEGIRQEELLEIHVASRNIKYGAFSRRFEMAKPKMLENE